MMICNEKMFSEDARIFRAKVQVTLHHQVHAIPMPYSCPVMIVIDDYWIVAH